MIRTTVVVLCAGLVALSARAAQAGDERYKWWQSERIKAEIGLTDDQSQRIEAVFQSMLPRMRGDKEALDRHEKVLSRLMSEATVEEATIVEAIDQVEAARAGASKTRLLMLYRMYRVLSSDQREKLDAIHQRLRQERRERDSSTRRQ